MAHNAVGRFTHKMASQLMIGFSWNSSSVSRAERKNSVLFPTVHSKLIEKISGIFGPNKFQHNKSKKKISLIKKIYHVASIGSESVTTLNMYSPHVINLNNRLAIRILKPAIDKQKKGRLFELIETCVCSCVCVWIIFIFLYRMEMW